MSDLATAVPEKELLVIERLAAALEKCASVDEIKDVRDRAMCIQMYARKKAGGLAAAQAAGRIVTEATLMLARLYAEEKPKPPGPRAEMRDRDPVSSPVGKLAVAKAADMDHAALSRLAPVVAAPRGEVRAAMATIEARGDVVTPNALRVQLTATSSQADYDGDEWYTPPDLIAKVRAVLGEIDIDPASNAHAQKTVRAKRFYTKEDDGLSKPWSGRVFCNPPYSTSLVQAFTRKLLAEKPEAAIYLVNNCTDAGWFHELLSACAAVCFTRGRLAFFNRSGQAFQTRQGQAIFYFGSSRARFRDVFGEAGSVLERLT